MRILLISSAYNSMTQRVHVELADCGHEVSVELALGDEVMRDAVHRFDPDLVIAPMLTTAIPADIWSARPCFIIHPGPRGDRGPSSLDWAIMGGAGRWGVTVLQANAEMDAGDIWSSAEFPVPRCSKSSLYRTEVADAALGALLLAVTRFESGSYRPEPLDYSRPGVTGKPHRPTSPATGPIPASPVPGDPANKKRSLSLTGHQARPATPPPAASKSPPTTADRHTTFRLRLRHLDSLGAARARTPCSVRRGWPPSRPGTGAQIEASTRALPGLPVTQRDDVSDRYGPEAPTADAAGVWLVC